jgi:hypothetical protein
MFVNFFQFLKKFTLWLLNMSFNMQAFKIFCNQITLSL